MSDEVYTRMEYIQNVFLSTQDYMRGVSGLEEVVTFLDTEPLEYRSVAYESASMEVGLRDLSRGNGMQTWHEFYRRSKKLHAFHVEIGLGWAFGKTATSPDLWLSSIDPLMRWMVFDGVGYYFGLYRGRRTVKNQEVPAFVADEDTPGFDQGLGRRLWYIAKGDVEEVTRLISSFPRIRQPALWRGTGIACGYVGGTNEAALGQLVDAAAGFRSSLETGIALAAMSRQASGSITEDIEMACKVVFKMPLETVIINLKPNLQS